MSEAVNRGRAMLARMERTDSVSFYGARTVIGDLCAEVEALTERLELGKSIGEAMR